MSRIFTQVRLYLDESSMKLSSHPLFFPDNDVDDEAMSSRVRLAHILSVFKVPSTTVFRNSGRYVPTSLPVSSQLDRPELHDLRCNACGITKIRNLHPQQELNSPNRTTQKWCVVAP